MQEVALELAFPDARATSGRQRVMAKFRPAATETLAHGMPGIGIPGFVPWQNKMPNYFFATVTLKVQLHLFVTSAKAVSAAKIPVSPSVDFPPVPHHGAPPWLSRRRSWCNPDPAACSTVRFGTGLSQISAPCRPLAAWTGC